MVADRRTLFTNMGLFYDNGLCVRVLFDQRELRADDKYIE